MEKIAERYLGCLIGVAAGDALGFPVERMTLEQIHQVYNGDIQYYDYNFMVYNQDKKVAVISDDTQMTLLNAFGGKPSISKLIWYNLINNIDESDYMKRHDYYEERQKPLYSQTFMQQKRGPGKSILMSLKENMPVDSKGCGAVMRMSPYAFAGQFIQEIIHNTKKEAQSIHFHYLGWKPAVILNSILFRITEEKLSLREICELSVDEIDIKENKEASYLKELLSRAIEYSKTMEDDKMAIKILGEGFTGDEALAIAIYCALKYQNDFSEALRVAVNHKGDSDSTGSITGAILGTLIGYSAIPDEWKDRLEPHDFIVSQFKKE